MPKELGINYPNRLSNKYFIDNNIQKVLFLDIDGVLEYSQTRFEHIRNGDMPKVYEELNEIYGVDYSKYKYCGIADVYYDWDKDSVQLLKDILVQSGAKIVLSSDWRILGKEIMYDLFKIHGLHEFYIDDTINFMHFDYNAEDLIKQKHKEKLHLKYISRRVVEILEYLERHPFIKNYVVIDDMDLLPGLEGHFVHTSCLLFTEHADMAKKILSQ